MPTARGGRRWWGIGRGGVLGDLGYRSQLSIGAQEDGIVQGRSLWAATWLAMRSDSKDQKRVSPRRTALATARSGLPLQLQTAISPLRRPQNAHSRSKAATIRDDVIRWIAQGMS